MAWQNFQSNEINTLTCLSMGHILVKVVGSLGSKRVAHFSEDLRMPTYNGIETTKAFYEFFAPHFVHLISNIHDPREQDNVNLHYSLSSYLSVIVLGLCQGATTM
jgi:hypothetical protein